MTRQRLVSGSLSFGIPVYTKGAMLPFLHERAQIFELARRVPTPSALKHKTFNIQHSTFNIKRAERSVEYQLVVLAGVQHDR